MTVEDLHELAEEELARQQQFKNRILYCAAAGCISCGSLATRDAIKGALKAKGMEKEVEVVGTGCMGLCGEGPLVKVASDGTVYERVDAQTGCRIVDEHLCGGGQVEDHRIDTAQPFFAAQQKIVLENCGKINAESIEEYIAAGGYAALAKAVTAMQPLEVIEEIRKSGLRGRGGAG